jgi:hypothetical protein
MYRVSPERPATCNHTDVVDDILALICAGAALSLNQELGFLLRAESGGPMVNTQKLFDPNQKKYSNIQNIRLGKLSTVASRRAGTRYSVDNNPCQWAGRHS